MTFLPAWLRVVTWSFKLWFVGEKGPEGLGVGVVRYHLSEAPLPANLSELHKSLNRPRAWTQLFCY